MQYVDTPHLRKTQTLLVGTVSRSIYECTHTTMTTPLQGKTNIALRTWVPLMKHKLLWFELNLDHYAPEFVSLALAQPSQHRHLLEQVAWRRRMW
jgi:hypothetical protein